MHREYATNGLSMSINVEGIDSVAVEHAYLLPLEEGESQMRATEGESKELPDIQESGDRMSGDSTGHPSSYDPDASAG
eukprot:5600204-Pyramimonas_sp.AAC.2